MWSIIDFAWDEPGYLRPSVAWISVDQCGQEGFPPKVLSRANEDDTTATRQPCYDIDYKAGSSLSQISFAGIGVLSEGPSGPKTMTSHHQFEPEWTTIWR